MTNDALALEVRNITTRFPGVLANDRVNFDLRKGEIHALLGENGAGKTTLMNIIYGLYTPNEGEFFISNGGGLEKVDIRTPHDAIRAGIGMVHQHFMLDIRTARQKIIQLSEEYGLEIDPDAVVED